MDKRLVQGPQFIKLLGKIFLEVADIGKQADQELETHHKYGSALHLGWGLVT